MVNWAVGFHSTTAYSAAGGTDRSYFYDSVGDDAFVGRPDDAWLVTAAGVVNWAVGFHSNTAYSTAGGTDRSYFYDSAGDDAFVGRPNDAWLVTAAGVVNYVQGFEQAYLLATPGGQDNVYLYDDPATADVLSVTRAGFGFTTGGRHISGSGLGAAAHVNAYASGGGDSLHEVLTDYLFKHFGDWTNV